MRTLPSMLSPTATVGSGVAVGLAVAVAVAADEDDAAPPHAVARTIALKKSPMVRMNALPRKVIREQYDGAAFADVLRRRAPWFPTSLIRAPGPDVPPTCAR